MTAPLYAWLVAALPDDVERAVTRLREDPAVDHVALMPDVHLSHDVCIGTVVGSADRLFPAAVGGDIGCGMAAARFDGQAALLDDSERADRLLRLLSRLVPAGSRPSDRALVRSPELEAARMSTGKLQHVLDGCGRRQIGTLGRGSHFLELQADDQGALWVMVHSGSRGLGPAVRDHHVAVAERGPTGLASLPADADEGRAYLADLEVALGWAAENRRGLVAAAEVVVGEVLGLDLVESSRFDCHHNHVRQETWAGRALWVHRKGACPAGEGELGIVPGSMGTASFHVEGRGHPDALGSSAHGAGRAMSRTQARHSVSVSDLRRQLAGVWYDRGASRALLDEAPAAYKDIGQVMRAQRDLVAVVRRLAPVLSYKAAG